MKSKRKNRREKNNEREIRIKRMSVFGLKIETRDDFDENNYEDFQNVRREIKDTTQSHRIGPAPVQDFNSKQSHHSATSPGSLDSDLEENYGIHEEVASNVSKAGCRGLIMYFSKLGRSEGDEKIDFEFVDSLLRGGADINFPDRHGQTCMHEIARGWHTDVAQFALTRRVEIDKCDNYGRTPLHLATAVNYPEMVFWLLNNGARLDARTKGENQTPIHYAAKHNAVDAMKVLLHMGANICDRDYKNRTPLFVAAETGRSQACRFLLEQGAPAGVYDDGGTSALTLMIEKMPDIAKIALGQFEVRDKALRKKYFYLNYLESETWKRRATIKGKPLRQSRARTPLEAICRYNETELIMHPVILRLIAIKWQLFGKFRTAKNTCLNLLYTIMWTILGVTMPKDERKHFYTPLVDRSWRIILEAFSLAMAFYFIARQVLDFRQSEQFASQYKEWKRRETERDLQYCHARWPEERRYLTSEISLIKTSSRKYFKNGWNVFELFTNLALAAVVITRIVALTESTESFIGIHYKAFSIFLIMLWLRFMRSCQCYQSLGPFITMLGHVITDTMKFGFLFMEFFIPYVCAFWILFGGHQNTQFYYFNDVLYNVFLMTLVDEYDREDIMSDDKVMAQILVGTYLAIASVVCVNLYIALMSQTFTRVYQNAKATAFMQQANHLLNIERTLGKKQRNRVKRYMMTECSPQIVYDTGLNDDDDDDQSKIMLYRMMESVQEIKDKLLVLVMHSTNGLEQNAEEENLSIVDVNTQVEIVRRKCDSLEAQLDDLQSYMHQIKEMIESKTLIETHQLANIDDIIRVLPQATIDIKNNNNNVNKHDQSVDGDPENIRKISNVEEKLNRVIDVLSDTYQQRTGGRQDIARFQNKNRPQYEFFQTAYNDVPQRPLYYESDSPYSSLNYKDHRYIKRPRQYYDDRRLYYEQRPQQYGDSEKSETLSDFEEFQRFKEFQKVQKKKEQISDLELKSRTTAASPPSYDQRNDNFERLDFNLLGRNEQQFNTFPSTKNNKKNNGQKPHTSDANSIDGRQSRCRNRQPRVDDVSDESDRKFLKGNFYGRRSNSIQNDAERNILTEKMHRKPNGVASDASSEFTRRNSHRSQDNYSSSEDCIAKENETETDFVKERSNNISRSISSISQSRDRSSSLSQSKEEKSNGDKRRRPSLRKENSLKNGKRKNRRDSSGSDHPVQAVQRKSLHSLLKKYGLDPEKFELQVEEANGENSQSSREPSDEADRAETEEFALELENTNVKSDGGPQINRESAVYDEQEQQPNNSIYFRDQENDYLEDQNISKFHQKDDAHPFHSDDNENVNDSDENLIALNQRVSDDLSEQADIINETEVSEFNNDDEKRENSISERTPLNDIPNPEDENNNFRNEDSQLLLDDRKPVVKINAKTRRTTWTLQKLGSHLKDTTL